MLYSFKIINYQSGNLDTKTATISAAPVVGEAVLIAGVYYAIMHRICNEANTYIASPINPPAPSV